MTIQEALLGALDDPGLGPAGGCRYVKGIKNPKRCIIGTVLHRLGVDDETLRGDGKIVNGGARSNGVSIAYRRDLMPILVMAFGEYAEHILRTAQSRWDSYQGDTASAKDSIRSLCGPGA